MSRIAAAGAFLVAWVVAGVTVGATVPVFVLLGAVAYAVFHVSVLRLSLVSLAAPDERLFERRWARYAGVAAGLVLPPAMMALQTLSSGHWVDGSWALLAPAARSARRGPQ